MVAYDGAQNPYRKFSMMAMTSPLVGNTIVSHAIEWMFHWGRVSAERTLQRQHLALDSLRKAIGGMNVDLTSNRIEIQRDSSPSGQQCFQTDLVMLAAVLMQVANSFFIGLVGVDVHLNIALHFLQSLNILDTPCEGFVLRFLLQRFAMLDITTSLTQNRRPYLSLTCWFLWPDPKLDVSEPPFREMTGCPQPLWVFLARLCHLRSDLSDESGSFSKGLAAAFQIETELRVYGESMAVLDLNGDYARESGPEAIYYHTLGQCWYWCAHLVLQLQIYKDPKWSPRVQETVTIIMTLMKTIPVTCNPSSRTSTPLCLLASGVCAQEDKKWVTERNDELRKVFPCMTRDETMTLIQETWQE
ncbi:uncharacterized protein PV07_10840 [Cladophialophora immunda]|uniref:Transcription factor domain-containing protein n=1 Tax=Cladophialophora immunda TaxID=569365 RepID=A0A0D1ZBR9_9EURO|nr:uncharacterized protein PV07_10840 [Cladophialophora immunda]KIW25181.1 hypothetical protein PV07_10840 [Cladophialophora immunda]